MSHVASKSQNMEKSVVHVVVWSFYTSDFSAFYTLIWIELIQNLEYFLNSDLSEIIASRHNEK